MTDVKKLIYKLKTEGALTDNITIEISDLELLDDAADALEQLQAELERVTAERDAAVEDLEEIMFKGGHNIDTCHFCTNGQCYGRGGTQVCEPKWRGIKKEG